MCRPYKDFWSWMRTHLGVMLVGWALSFLSPALQADERYSFGVVPQQSASRLAEMWIPLLQDLSAASGVQLEFATAPNIQEFERRLLAGEYDFAYMNPYHFVVFSEQPGYRALAHQADKKIQGILVVHRDSRMSELSELRGSRLCFPSPGAFAASLLTRAALEQAGIDFQANFVGSHDSVYRNVQTNLCLAGGGIQRTFKVMDSDVRDHLRVFWKSQRYTPHAFAVHPRISQALASRIQQELVAVQERNPGILQSAALGPLRAAMDSDWEDVRALDPQRLKRLARIPIPN